MKIEEIRVALKDRRISMVAEKTGVHYDTIRRIRDGVVTNPSMSVYLALSEYLKGGIK